MAWSRQEMEQAERRALAPYAQFSGDSRGRRHAENLPPHRTEYQRDRDRIIHSRAFRRLEYKTQVFLNGTGDHYRTRLTHTIEVAAIARGIARVLRLNEDLVEAIALAHDLGHPPFGHSGEAVLNQLMREHGGFEHNRQSLRVVEELERKYPGFTGLNLTWEVREGLMKHFDLSKTNKGFKSPSLEAQVANLADEITYYGHDLDDGLDSGLLSETELDQNVPLWRNAAREVRREHGKLPDECRRYFIVRCLIDSQVEDVVKTSDKLILAAGVNGADEVRQRAKPLVQYSPARRRLNLQLRRYLYGNLYRSPQVRSANLRGEKMLQQLFQHYLAHPGQIGGQSRKRVSKVGLHRAVCDYLAGMTDRYAMQEHQRVFGSGT